MAQISVFKNKQVKEKINKIFTEQTGLENYHVVYGYMMKKSFLKRSVSSWILGYTEEKKELIAIHIRYNGEVLESPFYFNAETLRGISLKNDKLVIDSTKLLQPITIIVPKLVSEKMEAAMIYPIEQAAAAGALEKFVQTILK